MDSILTFISNLVFKTHEEKTLNGVDYLVVNGVPIVEGILNGAFVPMAEFGAFAHDWNGIDLVLRHPDKNGGSAKVPSPDVQVLGRFYNASVDDGRKALVGEYWFNKAELMKTDVGRAVYDKIIAGIIIQTSTGYFAQSVTENGQLTHRNIHPDHIAVLPDEIGACSVLDGCGINRNVVKNCSQDCAGFPAKQTSKVKENDMSIQEIIANLLGAGHKVTLKKNVDAQGSETFELAPEVTQNAEKTALEMALNDGWLSDIPSQLKELKNLVESLGGIEGVKKLLEFMPTAQLMAQKAIDTEAAKRQVMIAGLVANTALGMTEAQLEPLPTPALEAMAKLGSSSIVDYSGRGALFGDPANIRNSEAAPEPPSVFLPAKK